MILDLFCGAGGFGEGFKKAGFSVGLANDIWKSAAETYRANNPSVPFIESDIRTLTESSVLPHFPNGVELVIGGPPCQGFSLVNTHKKADDPRNFLFLEYARVLKFTSPKLFIMENVKNMASMKTLEGGKFVDWMLATFKEAGYNVKYKVLNSKYYDTPQARERVIIVGTRSDLPDTWEYPLQSVTPAPTLWEAISPSCDGLPNDEYPVLTGKQQERFNVLQIGQCNRDLPDHLRTKAQFSNQYKKHEPNKVSPTVTNWRSTHAQHPYEPRMLKVREIARIQTFPDTYVFKGSLNSQYQQLGNAVPVNLAYHLALSTRTWLNTLQ